MFNDIEENVWNEEDFEEIEGIDNEYEEKAIELFLNNKKEKLKEIIEEISEYYDENQYLHILALYKILNNENAKEIIEKTLKCYKENKLVFPRKIVIFLTYTLTKYYKDKNILEKLYTYILRNSYEFTYGGSSSEDLYDIVDSVLESREWLINNVELSRKERTIINFITLLVLENTTLQNMKDKEIEKNFKNYVLLLWELREFIDIEKTFAPLLKGIGWSYVKNTKNNEDIINYFISLGVDENIAKELLEIYLKNDKNDNGDILIEIDIPF